MLIAVQPSKITFIEMQFISTRSTLNFSVPVVSEDMIDDLFDAVSMEMAEFLGLVSENISIVSLA